jgi:L-alanine-DL-glutamate epimerase-like enolase superfamily enzyme
MAIASLTAHAVSIPLSRRTSMATRQLDNRDYLLIEVASDTADAVGVGYAYVGTLGAEVHAQLMGDLLGDLVVGADEHDIVGLWERAYRQSLLAGRRGAVLRVLSALDMAMWDLAAKRLGVPLAVLLGGSTGPVPAYASGGYYRPDDGPWVDAVSEEIAANRVLGFTDHKIKVGGLSVADDAERVAAAVAGAGPHGRVALDANNAYRSADEAIRAIRAFVDAAGDAELWWVEEPLSPDDIDGHARIAAAVPTPIATGEIHQTRWEFRALIERRAAAILQPDAGVVGGVTEWMRVARTAEAFDLPIAPHWHANVHAQLARATPGCLAIEHFTLDKDIYNFERLLTPETRLAVADGQVHVGDRPGLGFDIDIDALRRFTTASHGAPDTVRS